jgi:hypothetical protein
MNLLEDDAGAEALALERTTGGEGEYQRSGEAVSIRLAFCELAKTIKVCAFEGRVSR